MREPEDLEAQHLLLPPKSDTYKHLENRELSRRKARRQKPRPVNVANVMIHLALTAILEGFGTQFKIPIVQVEVDQTSGEETAQVEALPVDLLDEQQLAQSIGNKVETIKTQLDAQNQPKPGSSAFLFFRQHPSSDKNWKSLRAEPETKSKTNPDGKARKAIKLNAKKAAGSSGGPASPSAPTRTEPPAELVIAAASSPNSGEAPPQVPSKPMPSGSRDFAIVRWLSRFKPSKTSHKRLP